MPLIKYSVANDAYILPVVGANPLRPKSSLPRGTPPPPPSLAPLLSRPAATVATLATFLLAAPTRMLPIIASRTNSLGGGLVGGRERYNSSIAHLNWTELVGEGAEVKTHVCVSSSQGQRADVALMTGGEGGSSACIAVCPDAVFDGLLQFLGGSCRTRRRRRRVVAMYYG